MDKYVYRTDMTFYSTNADQTTAFKNDLLKIAKDSADILDVYFPEYASDKKNCGTVTSMHIGENCVVTDKDKRYAFDIKITGCGDTEDRVFPESVYAAVIKKYYPAVKMEYRRYVYSESLCRKDGCGTGLEAVYGYGDDCRLDLSGRGEYACAVLKWDDENEENGFASFEEVFRAYDARDIYENMADYVDEEEYNEKYSDCGDEGLPELWGDLDSEIDDKGYAFSAAIWSETPVKDLPFAGSTVEKFDVAVRNISSPLKGDGKGGK